MVNIRGRVSWLILIVLAGLAAIVVGRYWLFVEAACSRLQDALLFTSTTVMILVIGFHAIRTRNDAVLSRAKTIGLVFVVSLLAPAVAGPLLSRFPAVRAEFCATCDQLIERAEELRKVAERESNPQEKLGRAKSAEYFARQCIAQNDIQARTKARRELARILLVKTDALLENKNCPEAKTALDEALDLAKQCGPPELELACRGKLRIKELICAIPTSMPTATPTLTPTPTPTPTPTFTPTPTHTPTPTPEGSNPCHPPARPARRTDLIVNKIEESDSTGVPKVFAIQYLELSLEGNEIICLASSSDGRGSLRVDDKIEFLVKRADGTEETWHQDFYDPDTGGIKPSPSQDISWIFKPGDNEITVTLLDRERPKYSADPVWLIIWTP